MPVIAISGVAQAILGDPQGDAVTYAKALSYLHGMYSEDLCADHFEDPTLREIGLRGGRLRFVHSPEESSLRITTTYDVPRALNDDETERLVQETLAQWSDGLGSGSFCCHRGQVLSTALALAIQNVDPSATDLGDLFVDAFPAKGDRDVRIEFRETGIADDALVADLVAATASDNAAALVDLGQRYEEGEGVPQDNERAFEMYSRAADQGHPLGATLVGQCLLHGRGTTEDQSRALACFQEGAMAGFPLAMHCLGECYAKGLGVDTDENEAVRCYRSGSELGDPGCLAELGECLEFGRGTNQNLDEALDCYQQALECGFDAVEDAIDRVEQALGH